MKAATVKEIKDELLQRPAKELVELCLRLSKFKKENKELLTYQLFESHNESAYIESIKEELHVLFGEVNRKSLYIAKKNLRKIVRTASRFIRYSNEASTEAEVLIYVCEEINNLRIDVSKSTALQNLYDSQIKKIKKAVEAMHADLQYDYRRAIEKLEAGN